MQLWALGRIVFKTEYTNEQNVFMQLVTMSVLVVIPALCLMPILICVLHEPKGMPMPSLSTSPRLGLWGCNIFQQALPVVISESFPSVSSYCVFSQSVFLLHSSVICSWFNTSQAVWSLCNGACCDKFNIPQ